MRRRHSLLRSNGLTLLELMISVAITALIAVALAGFMRSILRINAREEAGIQTYYDGLVAMERMTGAAKRAAFVLIPNGHSADRPMLAVTGFLNDDGDFYFGDSLFPRIDEDVDKDSYDNGVPGILGVDDDGDGYVDTSGDKEDDDEDKWFVWGINEDILDGADNDGDGCIDEDLEEDMNGDGYPGYRRIDDDGNGVIDDGKGEHDDDEDGDKNEDPFNPRWYEWDSQTGILWEYIQNKTTTDFSPLCENVTDFRVQYRAPGIHSRSVLIITLTVTGADGTDYTYDEYVHPRNTEQYFGKRVR